MPAPPTQQQWPVPGVSYCAGFPTPNQKDFFVYVYRDSKVPGFALPEYGEAHPNDAKYPVHKVTLVNPDEDAGRGWWVIVYAKDLENQDGDNFNIEYPYGPARFPRIARDYILPRASWIADGPVALGTADPQLDVEGNPVFAGATLTVSDELIQQTGDPRIDSLYVKVRRIYEHIPNLSDATDLAAVKGFGYKIEYPYGVTAYPRITWRIPNTAATAGTVLSDVCPIAGFTAASFGGGSQSILLIDQSFENDKGQVIALNKVYECNPGPTIVESEYEPRTGSPVRITKQIVAQSSIPATAALMYAELNGYTSVSMTSIAAGLATSAAVHGLTVGQEIYFSGMTSLTGVVNGDNTGNGAYYVLSTPTTATFTYASKSNGATVNTDAATGGTLYRRTVARGTIIEYKALGMDGLRSVKVTSQISLSNIDFLNGATSCVKYGTVPFSFPDVLNSASWLSSEAYNVTAGWTFDLALVMNITQGYSGPCRARITEIYTANPQSQDVLAALPAPYVFSPQGDTKAATWYFAGPNGVRAVAKTFALPPTLHAAITVGGNTTPANASGGSYSGTIAATTPTSLTYVTSNYFVVKVEEPELWKFGIYVIRIIEAKHPS